MFYPGKSDIKGNGHNIPKRSTLQCQRAKSRLYPHIIRFARKVTRTKTFGYSGETSVTKKEILAFKPG
jgi:hypothetical protein